MAKLRNIVDTWNMIDEYGIKDYKDEGCAVIIPDEEFDRLLATVKNKDYILNLKKASR